MADLLPFCVTLQYRPDFLSSTETLALNHNGASMMPTVWNVLVIRVEPAFAHEAFHASAQEKQAGFKY